MYGVVYAVLVYITVVCVYKSRYYIGDEGKTAEWPHFWALLDLSTQIPKTGLATENG